MLYHIVQMYSLYSLHDQKYYTVNTHFIRFYLELIINFQLIS